MATTTTPATDGNSSSCSRDNTWLTATECQPRHPHEERYQGALRTARKEFNNCSV